jgi:predicted metal-dependent phosphoesterase TrpH
MKTKYIDLHTHTNYSDGIFHSPQMLVTTAFYNGINILAKTDHDSVAGFEETKREADKYGMTLIPGVEITAPTYHLLAYNFERTPKFLSFLEKSKKLQEEACDIRAKMLNKIGVPITLEKVLKMVPESRLGKHNLIFTMLGESECRDYLLEKHPNESPHEIFKYYFGSNGIGDYIPNRPGVSVEEAIREVHLANGVIGIAHPTKDIKEMSEMEKLVEQGIDFMEFQPLHTRSGYVPFIQFAKAHNLPITYGSDYHGPAFRRPILDRQDNVLTEDLAKLLKLEVQ